MAVKCGSGPRPAAHTAKRCFLNCLETSLRPSIRPPSCTAGEAPCQRTVSQSQNTMAVKCGSGSRPAAHTAKRCFLNCLETIQTFHSPAFLHWPVSQSQNTMAVKYGSGPRPAAHTAKRCFLNCLETSLRPSIRPPSCTASKAPLKGRSRRAKTPWQ